MIILDVTIVVKGPDAISAPGLLCTAVVEMSLVKMNLKYPIKFLTLKCGKMS